MRLCGRTYTLEDAAGNSGPYFLAVGRLADSLLSEGVGARELRDRVRRLSGRYRFLRRGLDSLGAGTVREINRVLRPFTSPDAIPGLGRCARGVFDPVLGSTRVQHHLYMLEIELTNRLNCVAFRRSPWRMALLAHCLRDHQPACSSVPGEVEQVCRQCRPDCVVNKATEVLWRRGIRPFISSTMDHEDLFGALKSRHPNMAVLGAACVPELAMGMRLVERLGIPVVGVPLDANRCARWSGETLPTALNLQEVAGLVGKG